MAKMIGTNLWPRDGHDDSEMRFWFLWTEAMSGSILAKIHNVFQNLWTRGPVGEAANRPTISLGRATAALLMKEVTSSNA
jgi:hypothetical protein